MVSYPIFKEELARRLAEEPSKEPRVDTIPPPSDEDVEAFSNEISEHPIPSRHHGGGS